jgi:hypothetical protein
MPENQRPPNKALQRTRSAPLRSPLSFETLGDSSKLIARLVLLTGAALAATTSCTTSHSPRSSDWCLEGKPLDFGKQRARGLYLKIRGPDGPVVGAKVRWRANGMSATRDWQEWQTGEEGFFGVTDKLPGEFELDVCAKGYRPLHGIVVVDQSAPSGTTELAMERSVP